MMAVCFRQDRVPARAGCFLSRLCRLLPRSLGGTVFVTSSACDTAGQQKRAKPKRPAAPGDRDFEAARQRGARSGIPRRSGNRDLLSTVSSSAGGVHAATLFSYHPDGTPFLTALDLNTNGVIDLSGPDRVTGTSSAYEKDASNLWWRVSRQWIYPESGSASAVTTSVQRTLLTGLGVSASQISCGSWLNQYPTSIVTAYTESRTSASSAPLREITLLDRAAKTVTQVTLLPTSVQPSVQTAINGLPASTVSSTAVTNTYTYDGLGRQIMVTDSMGNTNSTHYTSIGLIDYTEDATGARTLYAHDIFGRTVATTDALSNTVHTAFTDDDQIAAQWGATYPVAYAYDAQFRKTSMRTYRTAGSAGVPPAPDTMPDPEGGDLTRWLYDNATGLCTNKAYADNSRIGYTFTPSGQPQRTTWARGVWKETPHDAFGQPLGTAYSDASPAITLSLNRLGTVVGASDSSGLTHACAVDDAQTVTNETLTIDGRIFNILQSQDAFEYPETTAVRLTNAVYASKTRAYDDANRLASLAFTNSHGRALAAAYAYANEHETNLAVTLPNGGTFTRSLTRDPRRPALATRHDYVFNGSPFLWYASNRDILGRVTNAVDSFSVLRDYLYNTRSEVTGANIGTNTFGYAFDDIGNRTAAHRGTEITEYAANSLNQYTQISVSSAPSVVNPTYDADGNMLSDGRFAYTWDAENRLTSATSLNPALNSKRLLFRYDWRHRLTTLTSQSFDGTAWTHHETRTFIYDGWLLSLELLDCADSTHQTFEYFWGNDLSGIEQGAGGVGGLLAVSIDGIYHLPCYDHNGNITAYLSETGTLSAQYLYDAFGNILEQSGPLADTFRHRFSTKYFCQENNSYYYGYRFYFPELGRWGNRDGVNEYGGLNLYGFLQNRTVDSLDWLGNCAVKLITGGTKPKNAPPDAGGWYEASPPIFGSTALTCPAGQEGIAFTVSTCSAVVWLPDNAPQKHRDHEFSHVKCLNDLKSQLSSLAIELGCECPSSCRSAHINFITANVNHAVASYDTCIARRDCMDNGDGKNSSKWCVDYLTMEERQKSKLKAVQEAAQALADACNK